MTKRVTILLIVSIFWAGGLPLSTQGQRSPGSAQQDRRLVLNTKQVFDPDGKTVDSLSGRHQRGDRTLNLSAFTVKKGPRARRGGPHSLNESSKALFAKVSLTKPAPPSLTGQNPEMVRDPYDPGYDYYYSYSGMSRGDGTIVAEAVYEYQPSASQNTLSLVLGGVTLTCDLSTEETSALSEAEQSQLEAWGAGEDANMVRDALLAIIEDGPQQSPSQLLLNYYAIALYVDAMPITVSGPRLDDSRKSSLHHAVSQLRTPPQTVSDSCSGRMIAPLAAVGTTLNPTITPAVSSRVVGQCFGCCGPGCYCIRDRLGFAMYSPACAQHDACVGQYGSHFARQCTGKLLKAVLFVWWRS
jgi:hypothetical protein